MDRTALWNTYLVEPLMELLRYSADFAGNAGVGIILVTVVIKVVFLPLTLKASRSQKAMAVVQPRIQELKQKYKDDKQKVSEETMKLYKEHGVNPLGGCLPLLLQMPVFFAFYWALINLGSDPELDPAFQGAFLWVANLAQPDVFHLPGVTFPLPGPLPLLAGVTQWVQQRMMTMPSSDPQQKMQNQLMQFMPLMIIFFGIRFAGGLALYWVIQNIVGVVQQYFITGWGSLPVPAWVGGARSVAAITPSPVASDSTDGTRTEEPRSSPPPGMAWLDGVRRLWAGPEPSPSTNETAPEPGSGPPTRSAKRPSRQRGRRRSRGKR